VRFGLALLAGVVFWLVLFGLGSTHVVPGWLVLLSLVLMQPVIEELLFRGLLQGQLLQLAWGRWQWGGFTTANLAVSVVFVALHFMSHPPLWALGVLFPSLLFGYFRDRHHCVYPSIALHVFYNAGFFLLPLIQM
jgi:membrane protease YdiL (CAAX protease family)